MKPYVSIVIPVHNEAHCLRETIFKVVRHCEHDLRGRYEVLLVENGSTDDTWRVALNLQGTYRPVRAFCISERSKAAAVVYGMACATGEYRYMCDCDLSTPIEELRSFLKRMQDGWDVVIASREHPDSTVERSFKRWAMGRIFHLAVETFCPELDYPDTQCGFKLFTAKAADDIFPRLQIDSPAFDVEVLYLAYRLGYYCTDLPVTYYHNPETKMRLVRDSLLMLFDLACIKRLHGEIQPDYKQKKIPA